VRRFKCDAVATVGVLAIAGGKGGTGKTTTALAVARELAATSECARSVCDTLERGPSEREADAVPRHAERAGTRTGGPERTRGPHEPRRTDAERDAGTVLVVDADVDMPDLHAMAGVQREPTVVDAPDGQPVPDLPGVRVAPAPPPDATTTFRERLHSISVDGPAEVSHVLVDAPCGAGPDAALALDVASGTVLVTRPTPAAVRDTAKTAAMARAVGTPVVAVAVVGSTPSRSLARVFDVSDVVALPLVDGDPLANTAHANATRELASTLSAGQTPF